MAKTLSDYARLVVGKKCRSCGKKLSAKVEHYPHDGGWVVAGFLGRQWLYVRCSKCGYQNALWKLWDFGRSGPLA